MKIAIGNDHVALDMKNHIKAYIESKGHTVSDFGAYTDERTDYPIYAARVSNAILSGECELGILICGTGVGMSIAANKYKGIRAACVSDTFSARLTRQHNDTNVLCFGARVVGLGIACDLCDNFLEAEYEGGKHAKRVDMIMAIEAGTFPSSEN